MTIDDAQSHQFAPVHSISFNTSASNGKPSSSASRSPLIRSSSHVLIVVVLKPNRCSSLNCAYQAKGNPRMLNTMPTRKRKPAIAQLDVPKLALNVPKAHGNPPL